jgi:HupE / UreJ protein
LRAVLLWLISGLLLAATPAFAHLTPNSAIELDFRQGDVLAKITIPQSEIAYALGKRLLTVAEVQTHLRVAAPDGRAWTTTISSPRIDHSQGQPDLVTTATLIPPPGAPLRRLTLHYDAIIDQLSSHIVLVFARSDFAGGVLESKPAMIGALRQGAVDLPIDRGAGSGWRGFLAALALGMQHIATGADHLLFLFTLLLPAPLLAAGGRWRDATGARTTFRHLVSIITAFTIGHSVTLIGGAFFGWQLPAQPVEVGIAVSILISAIHAFRPVFPGKEAFIAGGFGLIHGLAFATVISNFTLEPLAKAQAILGFNLGIELVQVALAMLVVPLLLWLARRPVYQSVRMTGAVLAGIAAQYWIWVRI